jgi:hypothetical protein
MVPVPAAMERTTAGGVVARELGRAAVRGAGAGVAEAAHQRLGARPATLVLLQHRHAWSISQLEQAKPWLDLRLLAAIPFLSVATIPTGTAVPDAMQTGAEQQGSGPFSSRTQLGAPVPATAALAGWDGPVLAGRYRVLRSAMISRATSTTLRLEARASRRSRVNAASSSRPWRSISTPLA